MRDSQNFVELREGSRPTVMGEEEEEEEEEKNCFSSSSKTPSSAPFPEITTSRAGLHSPFPCSLYLPSVTRNGLVFDSLLVITAQPELPENFVTYVKYEYNGGGYSVR
tara:strand:- start:626 stop:949 length:324 start_codon:yes stop_codon:yes gene_type:complete